nr:leucine-tRNA ligase (EC 6.1.1.4) - Escherichia coli (fragments) [Escherichia coli]
ELTCCDTK